jgi:uncharacterized protein YyaL (SSP411 family)
MLALFAEEGEGALYDAGKDSPDLLARTREGDDWAVPSGNSGAALLLLRLGRLSGEPSLEERGRAILRAFSGSLDQVPMGAPAMARALDFDLGPTKEIVLAGDPADPALRALERAVARRFLPRSTVAWRGPGKAPLPWLEPYGPVDGKAAAYVCEGGTCKAPITDPAALADGL